MFGVESYVKEGLGEDETGREKAVAVGKQGTFCGI